MGQTEKAALIISALSLILGWFLGLLSNWIIELTGRRRLKRQFKKALFTELRDFRIRLVAALIVIVAETGVIDRALLLWIEPILQEDHADLIPLEVVEKTKGLLKFSDEQLALYSAARGNVEPGLKTKKHSLAFLDAQLSSLSLFSFEFQRRVLDIRTLLALLNQEMDASSFYYEKTFDSSISGLNRDIVLANLRASYQQQAFMMKHIADKIGVVLSEN
jgi:hypothetical protein